MTVAQLLLWIVAALLLQAGAGIGIAVWRRRGLSLIPSFVDVAARDDGVKPAAGAGWRDFRVERREYEDAAQTQCSFYLTPVNGQSLPDFKPGQFLTFSLPIAEGAKGGRAITRCYSLSDRPDPSHYRVTIKRLPAPTERPEMPPGLSSNHFHDRVRVGDVLKVRAPSGRFFIDPDAVVPAVLIGGGIGITPMMSMLRWCLAAQPDRTIHLYYGLRGSREHVFKRQLEELAASRPGFFLNVVYSRPGPEDVRGRDYQHQGHIDVDLLRRTLPHGRHQFYVCGPPAMMQALVPELAEWGVSLTDLHYEAFGPASVRLPGVGVLAGVAVAAPVEVKFIRSGRTLTWDGADASLLDFAERHAVEVESGCRSGGCGTCETRIVEGNVLYERRPDYDVAPGHCLMCVCRPASPLVLEV